LSPQTNKEMASLVAHCFPTSSTKKIEKQVTTEIAENLIRQLYRLDDSIKWWGYIENVHFEQLDGIAQNIIYGQVPGYDKVNDMRERFNSVWEKYGPMESVFHYFYNQIEEILLTYSLHV
jgi:hypothetical protein